MGNLFISYRREDTIDVAGRIYDRLWPRFEREHVFKDVDSLPLGMDFRAYLRQEVGKCAVMLVIIGQKWLSVTDDHGRRRLENPDDFVRIEVEAALQRGIPVIPLLVQGAGVPKPQDLPASLRDLSYRHGTDLRADPHFHRDMDQLIEQLARLPELGGVAASPPAQAAPVAPRPVPPVAPSPADQKILPLRLATFAPPLQAPFVLRRFGNVDVILPPLCRVPAGPFEMGDGKDSDNPRHQVTLAAYEIGMYPVTVAEYACAVRAGVLPAPPDKYGVSWAIQQSRLDHPVVNVTALNALDYAAWLATVTGERWRLPSEAQWEKAARGTDGRSYPWGNQWDPNKANTSESGKRTTTPVGAYADKGDASPYGCHDMAGNVWEWCSSLYVPYPYVENNSEKAGDRTSGRVLRGGSWYDDASLARAACRNWNSVVNRFDILGFRVARGAGAGSQ